MSAFTVTMTPRQYETDYNGHLNAVVYHQWADHARIEYLRRAGITVNSLVENNVGPVLLQAQIRYLSELRLGDEVTVSVEPAYGPGKTWTVQHRFIRADGEMAAEIDAVMGLLDHATRRLTADAKKAMSALATHPDLL
jgi:acyl-CoA thioester hydrolase